MSRSTISPSKLEVRYYKSKVLIRIAGIQVAPLAIAYIFWASSQGLLTIERGAGFYSAIACALAMYVFLMSLLVKMIIYPTLLRVSSDGRIEWRPIFRLQVTQLPRGARVSSLDRRVAVSPPVFGLNSVQQTANQTTFQLPVGVEEIGDVSFAIE